MEKLLPKWLVHTLAIALALQPFALVRAEESDAPEAEVSPSDQQLAPGFLIALSSNQDRKLNGSFRIQKDGKIELPYNVVLQTQGMTLARFRAELSKAYQPYFKGTPNVSVSIKQKRYWVEIRGLVESPGSFLVKRESPMDEIISLAGGLSEDDLSSGYARIEQGGRTIVVDLGEYFRLGTAKNMPSWKGGERIFFQKERPAEAIGGATGNDETARDVQILGEIRTPGAYTFRPGADIYYYLVKTGGPLAQSDLDRVEQVRLDRKTGERETIHLGKIADVRPLQEGDILIFHPLRQTGLEKFLSTAGQVTSIVAAVVSAAVLVILTSRSTK